MTEPAPNELPRLAAKASPQEAFDALTRAGCCLIEGLAPAAAMADIADEMADHVESTPFGDNDFTGAGTRRSGQLLSRSPTFRNQLARHPMILDVGDRLLGHAPSWNLTFAHYFELFSGEPNQPLHRDSWKYGSPPLPVDVDLNGLWAVSDFTEENGATRVVPGSHLWDAERRPEPGEDFGATAPAGSLLLYTGMVFHGGGEHYGSPDSGSPDSGSGNSGGEPRLAINVQHSVSWMAQTERMQLSYPPETVTEWPDELVRFIGYEMSGPATGHWNETEDPFTAVIAARNRLS